MKIEKLKKQRFILIKRINNFSKRNNLFLYVGRIRLLNERIKTLDVKIEKLEEQNGFKIFFAELMSITK